MKNITESRENKPTNIIRYIILMIVIIATTVGLLTLVLDQKYLNQKIINYFIVTFSVTVPIILLLFIRMKLISKKDKILIVAASIIVIVETVTLCLERIYLFKGDWKGLLSILTLLYFVIPVFILVFIPWGIWFVIQFIKYRNEAFRTNAIPLWVILLLIIYSVIHYSIVLW